MNLEATIISSIFGQDNYEEVSFLRAEDFTDYKGKLYRRFWELIREEKAYNLTVYRLALKTENKGLISILEDEIQIVAYNNVQRIAVLMVERRFKRLLNELLCQLSSKSKSRLERELLIELQMAVKDEDIFDLSDGMIEYLGVHCSDYALKYLNGFLKYRDDRVSEVKKVINN